MSKKRIPLTGWDLNPHRAKFESMIKRTSGCWIWLGSVGRADGSKLDPQMTITLAGNKHQTSVKAARMAMYFFNGILPTTGEDVHRTCGNPRCVRPDHLATRRDAPQVVESSVVEQAQ